MIDLARSRIEKKYEKWDIERPYSLWLGIYIFYVLISFILTYCTKFFWADSIGIVDLKEVLSLIVQAQATLVAIIISLTLIAVQITAASYTPRVANYFYNHPNMRLLLAVYFLSICSSLYSIAVYHELPLKNQNIFTIFSIWFGIILFFSLIPFMSNTIDHLKPRFFIQGIIKEISLESLASDDDSLQSIFDVINVSFLRNDLPMARLALDHICRYIWGTYSEKKPGQNKIVIASKFCKNLENSARYCINNTYVDGFYMIYLNLTRFCNSCINQSFRDEITIVLKTIQNLCEYLTPEHKFKNFPKTVIEDYYSLTSACLNKKLDDQTLTGITALMKAGIKFHDDGVQHILRTTAEKIIYLGFIANVKGNEQIKEQVFKELNELQSVLGKSFFLGDFAEILSNKSTVENIDSAKSFASELSHRLRAYTI